MASGSGPESLPTYISQIQYRTWGAPKQITCGNGVNMTTGYNTRLQATSFSSAGLMGATLSYYSDGRIHTEQSTVDRKFDRAYTYDHEGRLTDALSELRRWIGKHARRALSSNLWLRRVRQYEGPQWTIVVRAWRCLLDGLRE